MATVNLGSIKFKWKGTYSGATAYTVDDVVEYNGSSYICKLASTGNLPTNTTYFDVMSSAGTNGTNGTDVGTVITTQGDLLYRDGSGLQRLGAGTAGQVLQTGGTGANPSWTNLSSDMVLISTTNYTANNVSLLDFDNVFTSTYRNYRIDINNYIPSSSSYAYLRFKDSSGVISGAYYVTANGSENDAGTGSNGGNADWNTGQAHLFRLGTNPLSTTVTNGGASASYIVYDPLSTDFNSIDMAGKSVAVNNADNRLIISDEFIRHWASPAKAVTGFRLLTSTGNINRVSVSIYGLKV
jgi:hypothetical protein